jgi:hypothetical protein
MCSRGGRRIRGWLTNIPTIVRIVVFKTASSQLTHRSTTFQHQPSRCQVETCAYYWHMALRTAALVPVPSLGFCPRSYNGSLTLLVTLPADSIVSLRASNHCVNSGEVCRRRHDLLRALSPVCCFCFCWCTARHWQSPGATGAGAADYRSQILPGKPCRVHIDCSC